MTPEQFSRLPQYAQSDIQVLRTQNQELRDKIDQFNGDKDSPITLNNKQSIPDGTIRFSLGGSHYINVRIDAAYLYVNAYPSLMVRPWASNVVHLFAVPL